MSTGIVECHVDRHPWLLVSGRQWVAQAEFRTPLTAPLGTRMRLRVDGGTDRWATVVGYRDDVVVLELDEWGDP